MLVELYLVNKTNYAFFIPFKSGLKWLSYGQLSPGSVVAWTVVPLIGGSFVAS